MGMRTVGEERGDIVSGLEQSDSAPGRLEAQLSLLRDVSIEGKVTDQNRRQAEGRRGRQRSKGFCQVDGTA
eukprot:752420-Hanusia_phi.AAC.1